MKYMKSSIYLIITVALLSAILLCDSTSKIGTLAGIFFGLMLLPLYYSLQDLIDSENWKTTQRQLERAKIITKTTPIRISFAYLYRISIDGKYLLIKNDRGTNKYQPVGGVYQLHNDEKITLKNQFHIYDDDKIPIDKSSQDDYRLRVENRYLRKFIKRFDKGADRERLNDLGREFKEELIGKEIIDWDSIEYRVCGRHMTNLSFEEHFQCYELLLADVVELLPNKDQQNDLRCLIEHKSSQYLFANEQEIKSLGVNTVFGSLNETIGSHTKKILPENESSLTKIPTSQEKYLVSLK